jgi:hypothetical protein
MSVLHEPIPSILKEIPYLRDINDTILFGRESENGASNEG